MSRKGVRLPVIGCIALALVCFSARVHAQQGGYRISGKVVNANTGGTLDRARVTIANARNRGETASVITGEDGGFAFSGLPAGKYSLSGARRGYIEGAYNQHESFSTAIVTGAGLDTEHLVLKLTPEAVIAGRILDESGEPVREAQVQLYREAHETGITRIRLANHSDTDDQGKYEFSDLPAGNYFISVTAKPWYALRPGSTRTPDGKTLPSAVDSSLDVAYPTTYYPDVTDSDEATPIPLRGGEHLSIDLHLHPQQALHLVVHVSGNTERGLTVPVLRRRVFDSSEFAHPESVNMIAPGVVELSGIPAGKYTVIYPDRETGQMGKGSEIDLTSDGQELDGSKDEGFASVSLWVQAPGQSPLPAQTMVVLMDSERRIVAGEVVSRDGHVTFSGVAPGKYTVLASAPRKGYSVVGMELNGVKSLGHSIDVAPNTAINGTVIVVGGSMNVEGVVQREGKPSSGAMVVLVPRDPANNRELFLRDQSDLDGSFLMPNVVPGQYTIVAIENGWDLDWSQPGVIAHYLPQGLTVDIPPANEGSMRLPKPVEVQAR